jgi:ketosteroid isomerase-like protein
MFAPDAKAFPPGAAAVIGLPAMHDFTVDYLKAGLTVFREETTDFYGNAEHVIDEGTYVVTYGPDHVTERGKYLNVWTQVEGTWKIKANMWNTDAPPPTPDAEVQAVVERFLDAVGRQDLDALPAMFAPGASVASAALRQGRWVTTSQSFEAWLAARRAAPRGAPYQEPVNEFTVHVADGQLAFVRADAYLIREGQRRSHNIDYFTLIRDDEGNWKFVNGSYTTKPGLPQ